MQILLVLMLAIFGFVLISALLAAKTGAGLLATLILVVGGVAIWLRHRQ